MLLVTLDTTRADRLGAYGFDGARTPALDAFARTAVVYERAYSTSSWTLPSHASIFTGLLPRQHGAQTAPDGQSATLGYAVRPLGSDFETLAERLASAGYRTAAVVSGPALKRELGVAQGFESYEDDLGGSRSYTGRRANDATRLALDKLASFGDEPWFLFVNYFDPHGPYRPPPPHDAGLPVVDTGPVTASLVRRLVENDPQPIEPWEREALDGMLAGYDAEIAYMDLHLGRLLAAVAAAPGGGDTLIAITSDHGESFGEHFYLSHGAHLYEDNVRVPLVVRWPGAGEPRRVATPVQNHHLYGSILAAAGLSGPSGIEDTRAAIVTEVGASDANVRLFGPTFDRRLEAYYAADRKLIRSSRDEFELYDPEADPGELRNLLTQERARATELHEALAEVRAAQPPLFDAGSRAELTPATRRALRELGYLATDDDAP